MVWLPIAPKSYKQILEDIVGDQMARTAIDDIQKGSIIKDIVGGDSAYAEMVDYFKIR